MDNDFYSVTVSEKAKKMLVSHAAFLAKGSPSAAEKLVEDFQKTASSLQKMPNRCTWFSGAYIPKHQYRYIRLLIKLSMLIIALTAVRITFGF